MDKSTQALTPPPSPSKMACRHMREYCPLHTIPQMYKHGLHQSGEEDMGSLYLDGAVQIDHLCATYPAAILR